MRAADYECHARDLAAFLQAVDEVLACSVPIDTYGIYPTWQPRPELASQFAERYLNATRLSGRAVSAFAGSGVHLAWQGVRHNPADLWTTMFERAALIDPTRLQTMGQQALGILDELTQRQRQAERGLAGVLARFVLFPARVREATGLNENSRRGKAIATAAGTAQALLIAIIGGVTVMAIGRLSGLS